jgi:hypothetical protein
VAALTNPDWGVPYICSVLELQQDGGGWRQIAVKATKDDAGLTPGVSVADNLRKENGVSSERLLESYTCVTAPCRNEDAPVPTAFVELAAHKTKRKLTDDDLSLWRVGDGLHSILFGIVEGDQLHAAPPIFIVGAEASAPTLELPLNDSGQYGLGVNDRYLLVAEEGSGAHPIVIDLRSGHLLLNVPNGAFAMWMPAGF